jgi:hypothetical protein
MPCNATSTNTLIRKKKNASAEEMKLQADLCAGSLYAMKKMDRKYVT